MDIIATITICTLKHDAKKIEGFITSLIEAENDDSESIIEGRNYKSIKDALLKKKAQAYLTTGDPGTKLTLERFENKNINHYALYAIFGHYHTSNNNPIDSFIESAANKLVCSIRKLAEDKPRVGVAAIYIKADNQEEQFTCGEKEKSKAALEYAKELWV